MRLLGILLVAFSAYPALSQRVFSGKILDGQTNAPLAGVSVLVGNSPRTSTDARGTFTLRADSTRLLLRFRAIGYEPGMGVVSPDSVFVFLLKPAETTLAEVVVRAYETDRSRAEVPAALGLLRPADLQRFAGNSLVPALNTLPGVRMEERSPGSYRLSIRGSTLRSPFGVRNVKVYLNGAPFTDPGGNTYLQQLDLQSIGSAEVLKGPGGSLYGAGTGGVLLLESPQPEPGKTRLDAGHTAGSFGLQNFTTSLQTATARQATTVGYSLQTATGYRVQSALRREVARVQSRYSFGERHTLTGLFLYSDLYYQTPGGLTRVQFEADPRQARPTVGRAPGAVDQQAALRLKTAYFSLGHQWAIAPRLSLRSVVYATSTQVANPAIRNYERREERSLGGRLTGSYQVGTKRLGGKLTAGAELQRGTFGIKTYGNRLGQQDTIQTDERIRYGPLSLFAQADFTVPGGWFFTTGLSYNRLTLRHTAYKVAKAPTELRRDFSGVLSPRLAVLKVLSKRISVYGSVSSGFSPPTVQEVRPSEGSFNASLDPERGTSYEAGLRGTLTPRLRYDLTAYAFRLRDAIVIRRTADGADYFANAGGTRQNGLEATVSLDLGKVQPLSRVWLAYAYQDYHFAEYASGGTDFSGNRLTGTPPNTLMMGLDWATRRGFYTNLTGSYVDALPVNDANSELAPSYRLLGGKMGYKNLIFKALQLDAFVGLDNALDQRYTPAPDLNAAAGRYYNAAAGRNFYGGVRLGWVLN